MDFVKREKLIRILLLLVCLVICVCIVGAFIDFESSEASDVAAPVFSRESGFYEDSFTLEIQVPEGTRVYYTLDSSDPDESSAEYTGPILLENASEHDNVYSMNTEVSVFMDKPSLVYYNWYSDCFGYCPPDHKVDKCNVVRAIAVDSRGRHSRIINASYFVGINPGRYDGCIIASLISSPENFFDYNRGIYVKGRVFDEYVENSDPSQTLPLGWDTNYFRSGKQWERECCVEFFGSDGEALCACDASTRIQGGWSRAYLPHSLNVYSRSGENFGDRLFGNSYTPTSLNFFSGGDQHITKFNDYMINIRTAELDYSVRNYVKTVMFLDGEYWGFYLLTEKYDAAYFSFYYGVDPDNIIMVKAGELEIGQEKQLEEYTKMVYEISSSDMTVQENYDRAKELLDINSFIDYYSVMMYIARKGDWPSSNYALWRSANVSDAPYCDGKWRWIMFDCNSLCMSEELIDHDTLNYILKEDTVFASLWESAEFRERFEGRMMEIADTCFDPDEIDSFIREYNEEMLPCLQKAWARFSGLNNDIDTRYYPNLKSLSTFFRERKAVVESWFG